MRHERSCGSLPRLRSLRRRLAACASAGVLAASAFALDAPAGDPATAESVTPVITNPADIWALSPEEKDRVHPIRLEGRVDYFDAAWKLCWISRGGAGTYIQLSAAAPAMRAGQRVRIEGSILPAKGLEAARARVVVLSDYEPAEPLPTAGRINDLDQLDSRMVTVEGYVNSQQLVDPLHLRLNLIVENRPVTGWVRPERPDGLPSNWQGRFVRFTGLYSGRFDPTHTRTAIEIWGGAESDLMTTGSLANRAEFLRPRTPIGQLYAQPAGAWVRIRGRLESQENGRYIVLRDDTGMVRVTSLEHLRLPDDAEVEAAGRVAPGTGFWVVDGAWFRVAAPTPDEPVPTELGDGPLELIEQVRHLDADEAARGRPVRLAGVVTWSLPENDFFFLQSAGAGVRVHFDRAKFQAPPLSKYMRVEGVTTRGEFAPVVEMKRFVDLGAMNPPEPRQITLEDALTGRWDSQYVLMRGFLQNVESEGDWRWLHLTTPAGDFVGHLQSPVSFVANPGSLVRLRGVCETAMDANGRVTGVTLRVAFIHDIMIEEDAPADPFDVPRRSLRTVNYLGSGPTFSRVRVAGTVGAVLPDGKLYVQDAAAGLLVLARDVPELVPGDHVEAVGIVGREGLRPLLREAVCRKTGADPVPLPLVVDRPGHLEPLFDSRLARVRGRLIDVAIGPENARLTLQADGTFFEATLRERRREALPAPGSGLELTGIYRVVYDDVRQSRGFEVALRSPADITVYQRARFWTLERTFVACGVLAGTALLFVAWITALRRRVKQQTEQLRRQLARAAELEAEVQRAARLESLGTLAGGIAHDFNNLLTIMLGNATLAMSDDRAMRAVGDNLQEIERGARRARDLTQQLLTFARGGAPHRAAADLARLVRDEVTAATRGTDVRPEFDFAAGLPAPEIDRDQIARTIRALVRNAVEAMPRGGRLRVSLAAEDLAAGARPGLAAGPHVRLSLADSGPGIAAEVQAKIFDPYFTTKHGSAGLGLATAYSVVRRHDGRIDLESEPGRGATFHLWLPVHAPETPALVAAGAAAPVSAPVVAAAENARPRVLVMDDEESIRRVIEVVLRRLGVDPIIVADGESALAAFRAAEAEGHPVNLLILDLTIPGGLGGRQVIEAIRQTAPAVPAIVSSGYSHDPVMAHYRDYGFQAVVQKPYDVSQLAAMVQRFVTPREAGPAAG